MRSNKLIFGQDERVAAWVAKQLPHVGDVGFGPCRAIAVVSASDRPLGAIVYHDFIPQAGTVQISMASVSPLWAQPQTVRDLLAIPFALAVAAGTMGPAGRGDLGGESRLADRKSVV